MNKVYRRIARKLLLILSFLFLLLLFLMFKSKFYMQGLSEVLSSLAMNVRTLELEVNLLEAEFAYLTTNSRVEILVNRHLDMEHIAPGAVVDATALYAEC